MASTSLLRDAIQSNKKSYGPYGFQRGTQFSTEQATGKIVGFHGRSDHYVNSIGGHLKPMSETLQAFGGEGGSAFEDGFYENVKKISVVVGGNGIQYISFEYENGLTEIKEHGDKQINDMMDEMMLDSGDEYLTSMSGTYANVFGFVSPVVQSLTFKTNKGNSVTLGFEMGTPFSYEGKSGKIVGFHGRAGSVLYKLGAYMKPVD